MVAFNEKNRPFVRFSDAASRERYHNHQNNNFHCERGLHLLKLQEKVVDFYARMIDFCWSPMMEVPPAARFTWVRGSITSYVLFSGMIPTILFSLNTSFINDVLKVPEVPNMQYMAKLGDMDFGWLRDTMVEPTHWDRKFYLSGNRISMTFHELQFFLALYRDSD